MWTLLEKGQKMSNHWPIDTSTKHVTYFITSDPAALCFKLCVLLLQTVDRQRSMLYPGVYFQVPLSWHKRSQTISSPMKKHSGAGELHSSETQKHWPIFSCLLQYQDCRPNSHINIELIGQMRSAIIVSNGGRVRPDMSPVQCQSANVKLVANASCQRWFLIQTISDGSWLSFVSPAGTCTSMLLLPQGILFALNWVGLERFSPHWF